MTCVTTKPIELILKLSVTLKPIILSVIMLSCSMLGGIFAEWHYAEGLGAFLDIEIPNIILKRFYKLLKKYNLQNWFEPYPFGKNSTKAKVFS